MVRITQIFPLRIIFTRLTRGAWPALPLLQSMSQRVGPEHIWTSERAQHTARGCLSLPPRLDRMRGDGAGRGDSDTQTQTHTHTRGTRTPAHSFTQRRTAPQHCSGRQSTPMDPRFHLVLVTTMGRRTATTSNGSKSFDPKTSSTRAVTGPQFMANPHHTQKTDSEPSGTEAVMQKRDSPDATFMMSD